MDQLWETPDLEAMIEFFAANDPAIEAMLQGKMWYRALRRVQHMLRRNSKQGAKRNIEVLTSFEGMTLPIGPEET